VDYIRSSSGRGIVRACLAPKIQLQKSFHFRVNLEVELDPGVVIKLIQDTQLPPIMNTQLIKSIRYHADYIRQK
jgi:hypothetical protein